MSFSKTIIVVVFLGVVSFFSSCAGSAPEMSPEERYAADTIYSSHLPTLRVVVDSICKIQKDSLYHLAVDSIKKERMEEIEMLLRKY